jgi:hypothetical protein
MARIVRKKELKNSRLLKKYASWIYCDKCNNTVAYLCYVTYDLFDFKYECKCGSKGNVYIDFKEDTSKESNQKLKTIKNRMCCPHDESALITIVDKNIKEYKFEIVCNACDTKFRN